MGSWGDLVWGVLTELLPPLPSPQVWNQTLSRGPPGALQCLPGPPQPPSSPPAWVSLCGELGWRGGGGQKGGDGGANGAWVGKGRDGGGK